MTMRNAPICCLLVGLVLGCTAPQATETLPAAALTRAAVPSNDVASDLAAADQAFKNGDAQTLSAILARLDNRGVRPLDDDAAQLLSSWADARTTDLPPLRGRLLGPGFHKGSLNPGQSQSLQQVFLAGEPATISLAGRSGQTMRLQLRDAKSRVICEYEPAAGRTCRFTPVFTQRYSIDVANGGRSETTYFLVID